MPGDMVIVNTLLEIVGIGEIAEHFGVSVEDYLAGQAWAREHLADVRRSAGLDPATGLPLEPTNGVEPQPTDVSAPRRNGHKASMVSHRTHRVRR